MKKYFLKPLLWLIIICSLILIFDKVHADTVNPDEITISHHISSGNNDDLLFSEDLFTVTNIHISGTMSDSHPNLSFYCDGDPAVSRDQNTIIEWGYDKTASQYADVNIPVDQECNISYNVVGNNLTSEMYIAVNYVPYYLSSSTPTTTPSMIIQDDPTRNIFFGLILFFISFFGLLFYLKRRGGE